MQRSPRINLGRCSKRSFGHEKKARKSFRSIVGDLRFPLFCYLISLKNGWIGPILAKKWTFFKFFEVKWKFWWWFWNQGQKWDEPFARIFRFGGFLKKNFFFGNLIDFSIPKPEKKKISKIIYFSKFPREWFISFLSLISKLPSEFSFNLKKLEKSPFFG